MQKPKFEILQWNTIQLVNTSDQSVICSICKQHIQLPCAECETQVNPDCKQVKGVCNHSYHQHCIDHWLRLQKSQQLEQVCPLCHEVWHPTQ